MAIISGAECGRDMAANATSCPNCGHPLASNLGVGTSPTEPARPSLTAGAVSAVLQWIQLAVVVVAALILNPSAETHRIEIGKALADRQPFASTEVAGLNPSSSADYHSFGIGSYTRYRGAMVSVGILGVVFVLQ